MAIIYIIGPIAVGKETIGRKIARQRKATLIQNHLWLNPLLTVARADGVTPLPAAFWSHATASRRSLIAAVLDLHDRRRDLVFTHAATGAPSPFDANFSNDVKALSRRLATPLHVFKLTITVEEIRRRASGPDRRAKMKDVDVERAVEAATTPSYRMAFERQSELDVSDLTPEAAARRICGLVPAEDRV